uniref:beta-glucosidase n=2 Tax=Clastoptera arizonana TaxID=38151 RepID=A0A1B6D5W8_9HEMI
MAESSSKGLFDESSFLFGTASASYQVEGAWNANGKGENIWDRLVHTKPETVVDKDTGDVACDSYHKYKEDVQLIKYIGFDFYRFSISWSRVLPTGEDNVINQDGISYYNNLINELLENGIQPLVTLYHWDLPQPLQDLGGWLNPLMAEYFECYARVIFSHFGDRVKWWITINEPSEIISGYSNAGYAPYLDLHGTGDYLAAHTLIRAHAKAYHLYDKEFRKSQNGKVSITINSMWNEPLTPTSRDKDACERAMQFELGLFGHPIYSKKGDYPEIVREVVDKNSADEKRSRSRLPSFTSEEIKEIRGTFDFFGLNHYTSRYVTPGLEGPIPSLIRDSGVIKSCDPNWPTAKSSWLKVVPWGFRKLLQWIKEEYDNPPVLITENGFSSSKAPNDTDRISYHFDYLTEMSLAIKEDQCNVIGYTVWSILDNFEWMRGYSERFGLYYVDFTNQDRPRIPKQSVEFFKSLCQTRTIPTIKDSK